MLSRLEAQSRPSDESVNMGSLLRTLEREAQALSSGRHQIQLIDDARCDLSGSTKELHSAFSNLVSKAVRYTPEGGKVRNRRSEERRVGKECVSTCRSRSAPSQ